VKNPFTCCKPPFSLSLSLSLSLSALLTITLHFTLLPKKYSEHNFAVHRKTMQCEWDLAIQLTLAKLSLPYRRNIVAYLLYARTVKPQRPRGTCTAGELWIGLARC
jgi:hypothetical protein